jgi:hypothetical protein
MLKKLHTVFPVGPITALIIKSVSGRMLLSSQTFLCFCEENACSKLLENNGNLSNISNYEKDDTHKQVSDHLHALAALPSG